MFGTLATKNPLPNNAAKQGTKIVVTANDIFAIRGSLCTISLMSTSDAEMHCKPAIINTNPKLTRTVGLREQTAEQPPPFSEQPQTKDSKTPMETQPAPNSVMSTPIRKILLLIFRKTSSHASTIVPRMLSSSNISSSSRTNISDASKDASKSARRSPLIVPWSSPLLRSE
jgi:hypothetical protein